MSCKICNFAQHFQIGAEQVPKCGKIKILNDGFSIDISPARPGLGSLLVPDYRHLPPHSHQGGIPFWITVQMVFRHCRGVIVHWLGLGVQRTRCFIDGRRSLLMFLGNQGDARPAGTRAQGLVSTQPQAHLSMGGKKLEVRSGEGDHTDNDNTHAAWHSSECCPQRERHHHL